MIVPFLPLVVDHGPDIALRQPFDGPLAEEIGAFCEHNGLGLRLPPSIRETATMTCHPLGQQ